MRRARLFEHSPATVITGSLVRTPEGEVRCGRVVVAVDGALERVLPELTGRVWTVRAQMLATGPAPEVDIPRPVYARWGWDYWQQLPDKRVALGGFRDLGGDAERSVDATPSPAVQRHLEEFLRAGLGVRAPITHRWAGCIAFTKDRVPIVEEVRERVWATGAYSGTGNVLGAVCARAAVQRALDAPSVLDGVLPAAV
ncbi:MAG: FAD-binding oxidoreductase [Euzebyales bacterium]|nr:FAD-binding oxidoreductase [Euzebyales bacterium]